MLSPHLTHTTDVDYQFMCRIYSLKVNLCLDSRLGEYGFAYAFNLFTKALANRVCALPLEL